MCLITGFVNFDDSVEKCLKVLEFLKYRGPDSSGIYFDEKIVFEDDFKGLKNENVQSDFVLGHNLLSIVGFKPQPLFDERYVLVSNCEIYNWKELNLKFELNCSTDSEVLFELLKLKGFEETLKLLDGVYAFCFFDKVLNKFYLTRDLIGEKPIFVYFNSGNKKFAFASEKKGLLEVDEILSDLDNVFELNPRESLIFDLSSFNFEKYVRELKYDSLLELDWNFNDLKAETKKLLFEAVRKRIPDKNVKVGILFSGGIDSVFIAFVLKELGVDFTCYTAKFDGGNIEEAEDLIYAREIAKKYNFKLEVASVSTLELPKFVEDSIRTIECREYIKVSVALPFLIACRRAQEDNVRVMFSGLGSEELFAGYKRHKRVESSLVNQECLNGFLDIYLRDIYRDDCITMNCNQELRLPFLDLDLVNFSLKIPAKFKLNVEEDRSKIILREISKDIGIDLKFSERQKKAAQYGSKSDKGILRLSKNHGVSKQEYLNRFEVKNVEKVYWKY